jgi:hypothetical protein
MSEQLKTWLIDTITWSAYCVTMKAMTIETEKAMLERINDNQHIAEMQRLFAKIRYAEVMDRVRNPLKLKCVVCGEEMKAERASKKTCSNRCRLKWSRMGRAYQALPKAEQKKRHAKIQKQWRREDREADEAEKQKPKHSLDEITTDIKASMEMMT